MSVDRPGALTDEHGTELVTTGEACRRLAPDVHRQRLRDWKRRGLLDVYRDRSGQAVRVPGRRGLENVWRWPDVLAAERATRESGRGRTRAAA